MDSQSNGYIYIMINASFPKDTLKIGFTKREPELRAAELSQATGLPSEYIVAYQSLVADCEKAERLIHQELEKYRITNYRNDRSREFFKIKLKDAIKLLDSISDEVGIVQPESEKEGTIDLEQYLKETYQTGAPLKFQLGNDNDFMAFNRITASHSINYKEEIEIYKSIGYKQCPKKFLDPEVRTCAERLFHEGIKEKIPAFGLPKIYEAARMGNVQAIKWLINKGELPYFIRSNNGTG